VSCRKRERGALAVVLFCSPLSSKSVTSKASGRAATKTLWGPRAVMPKKAMLPTDAGEERVKVWVDKPKNQNLRFVPLPPPLGHLRSPAVPSASFYVHNIPSTTRARARSSQLSATRTFPSQGLVPPPSTPIIPPRRRAVAMADGSRYLAFEPSNGTLVFRESARAGRRTRPGPPGASPRLERTRTMHSLTNHSPQPHPPHPAGRFTNYCRADLEMTNPSPDHYVAYKVRGERDRGPPLTTPTHPPTHLPPTRSSTPLSGARRSRRTRPSATS
jgi:hypothetical protein